jgi:hypothetical protein
MRHRHGTVRVLAVVALLTTGGCVTGGPTAQPTAPADVSPAVSSQAIAANSSVAATPSERPSSVNATSAHPAESTSAATPSETPPAPASSPATAPSPSTSAATTAPKPPFYRKNPACAKVRCELIAAQNGIPHPGGKLRLEVLLLPRTEGYAERDHYLALYDSTGKAVYTTGKVTGWYVPLTDNELPGFTGISVDRAGRVFVPFGIGAHGSLLVVLDASVRPVRTFDTVPTSGTVHSDGMRFSTDTPSSGALDVDGDGVNEVIEVINDYDPDYARGTSRAYYFKYQDGDFQPIGCTTMTNDTDISKPPQSAPESKACKTF